MKGLHQWLLVFCSLAGMSIQLNAQPGLCEAGFTITLQTGLTIEFNNLSDYVNSNGNFPPVSWDFGDNQTSTDYNPIHTYTDAGVYQVCVTASDGVDCQATFCDNVWVGTIDCEDFIVDINHSGLDIFASVFDPSNAGPSVPDVVEWYIPGTSGNIGTQPNLTYTFPSGGLQTVCLDYEIDGIFCQNNCYTFLLSDDPADCDLAQLTPAFTTTPNSNGLTLVFDNQSSSAVNTNVNTYWEFGDGAVSFEENPVHTFPTTGVYTVCLNMAYDAGVACSESVCSTYTVVDPASCYIDFFLDQTAGLSYTFETFPELDPMTQFVNLQWTIFDGANIIHTATDDPTAYTFSAAGSYLICVDADLADDVGIFLCPVSSCQTITVTDPTPSCSYSINYTLNGGLSGIFQFLSDDPNNPMPNAAEWYIDDPANSIATGNSVSFIFPDFGTFQVCAVYETLNNVCNGVICETVTVVDPADPTCTLDFWVDWAGGLDYAIGTFQAPNPNTYYDAVQWNIIDPLGGSTQVIGDPVTYSLPIPGDYTVCGLATVYDLASNVVCLVDSCQLVTVEDPCAYSISYLINGQTIDLNLSNPGFPAPDIATWFIDGPNGGVIGSGENIQYVFPEGGIYTVCIDYQVNGLACPAVLCETVTILEDCVASFSVTPLTVTDFQFDDLSTGNYSNFQWDFGDGLQSNALNPIHTYDVEGVYTVCLTIWDNDNFCQSTLCQDVTVDFSPICDNILLVAAFSVPPGPSGLTIDFSNNSITDQSFGVFYEWDFGDGATSIDENPSHTYSAPGVYNVCLDMGWDGPVLCYADPICMNITVPLSVPSCNAVIAQTVVDSYGLFEVINNDNPNIPYSHVDWTVALNGVNIFLESNVNPFDFDFPQPGVYQVCADVILDDPVNGICIQTVCQDVVINPANNCDILWGYNFISDYAAIFETTPPPGLGISYTNIVWEAFDNDGSITLTADPVTINFPGEGIYQVCITADVLDANGNLICNTTNCQIIDLDPNGTTCSIPPVIFDINEIDLEGYFELPPFNAPYLSYENISWVVSSSVLTAGSTDNPFLFNFPGPDTYTVCLSADLVGSDGVAYCDVTWCDVFPVFPPFCESIWEGDEHLVPGAQNNEAIFFNQSVGPYTEVLWDFGDGSTSESNIGQLIHVYDDPGVYNVCLTVADASNPDCNDTDCQLIFISGVNPCQFELDIIVDNEFISATVEDQNGNIPPSTNWYILESMLNIGTATPLVYTFGDPGVYTVCVDLSIPGTACMATLCEEITINDPDCLVQECVFPGDADYDQEASNSDVLNLGLGFGAIGTDRPNASNAWYGQPSPAWNQTFQDGTNYKHADCNGDGIIDFDDLEPIILNYNRTHDFFQPTNFGDNPDLFLIFDIDTLNVTNDVIDLEINADVFVGTQNLPVNDLYGLAFTIAYPSDLVQEGTAEGAYQGDQWFGPANTTLQLEVDNSDSGALDFAYSRTNLMNISGFGQIATCKFVISDNLMGFTSVEEFLFNVNITDILAVNALGQPILLDGQGDQVIILVDDTSTSTEDLLEHPIRIFPNPSSDVVHIEWLDANGQILRVFNTLGELVDEAELHDYRTSIQVGNYASGIYLISIQTENGTLTRRVFVE